MLLDQFDLGDRVELDVISSRIVAIGSECGARLNGEAVNLRNVNFHLFFFFSVVSVILFVKSEINV